VESPEPLPEGSVELKVTFDYDDAQGLGKGGLAVLCINGKQVAQGRIEKTVPFCFSMSGETFDVGIDTGAPVGPYPPEFPFTGRIRKVDLEVGSMLEGLPPEMRDKLIGMGLGHAAMASQ
jgi:arylsulfatase